MILRSEWLLDAEGEVVVVTSHSAPNLGGWSDPQAASMALRAKAQTYFPEALICGGYETQIASPATGLRERVTFWPDESL